MIQKMQKLKWGGFRILFIVVMTAAAASGSLLVYLFGPVYSWYFFGDFNFIKHRQYVFPMILCGLNFLKDLYQDLEFRSAFIMPLTAPPLDSPDLTVVRISTTWSSGVLNCSNCNNCCTGRYCPLLNCETNQCRSYGSFYWRYFNCGRFPESRKQIRLYDCPKWEVVR